MAEDDLPPDDPKLASQNAEAPEDDIEPDLPDDFDSEADEEPPQEVIDTAPARQSRAETRFQTLANETREARERAARLERELQEIKAQQQRIDAQKQEKEPTAEEMSLWSVEQQVDYKIAKDRKQTQQQLALVNWNVYETTDKAAFAAICAGDPLAKKYAEEVERELADLRSKGQNVEREKLLTYLVGKKVREGRGRSGEKQRTEGKARIARQQAPVSSSRSDRSTDRGRLNEAEARRKRLENFTF